MKKKRILVYAAGQDMFVAAVVTIFGDAIIKLMLQMYYIKKSII